MNGKISKFYLAGVFLLTSIVLSGCAGVRLYPVAGPLSTQTPPAVYSGKLTAHANMRSGTFTAVLADGEAFKGTLSLIHSEPKAPAATAQTTAPPVENLDAAWDTIYGQGYFLGHVLGEGQYGRAVITGSKGTVLQVEIHSSVSGAGAQRVYSQPKGVAKDSKGNLYKVVLG